MPPPSILEKRSSFGWIGAFYLPGCSTTGELPQEASKDGPEGGFVAGPRPRLPKNECKEWSATWLSKYVGINWGAGVYEFHHLRVYYDDDCKGDIKATIDRKGDEDGACYDLHDFERTKWRGVMAVW